MQRNTLALLLLLACALPSIRCQAAELPESTAITDSTDSTADTTTDSSKATEDPYFSCSTQAPIQVDLKGLSGQWFEVARVPDEDRQCVNYSLPDSPNADNRLELQVEYVDAADGKWQGAKQSSSLAWDDNSKNGVFSWNIGEANKEPVTYKLVSTDLTTYAFFCGYKGYELEWLFKVWTRQRELATDQMQTIEDKVKELGLEISLTWVEQSEENCRNLATRAAGAVLLALALAMFVGLRV